MFWTEEYSGKKFKIELSRGKKFLRINEERTYKKVEDSSTIEQINERSARWNDPYKGHNYYIQRQLNADREGLPNIRIIRIDEAWRIPVLFKEEEFIVTPYSDKKFTYYTRCKKEEVEK